MREGTSDVKAWKEVSSGGYERKNFNPLPGETWLDIGCHVGSFAHYYTEQGVKVIAFEPSLESYEIACQNAVKAEIHHMGLGAKNEEKTLYINSKHGNHWRNSTIKKWKGGAEETIQLRDVIEFLPEGNFCIKLDAEGAEKEIMQRLFETGKINRVDKLVFEWSFDILPYVPDYIACLKELTKTHELLNVTENHWKKYSALTDYPKSWFPAKYLVFAVRKNYTAEQVLEGQEKLSLK